MDFGERVCAHQLHGDLRRFGERELLAHEVGAAADVGQDVVRRPVHPPLLEGLQYALAGRLGDPEITVGHVRGQVVARCLERQPVAFLKGVRDETQRPPAADGVLVGVGARRAGHLVVLAVALVDLHHRFDLRVVVAPVRPHVGAGGVHRRDPVESAEILIEHLGVRRRAGR